MMTTVAPSAKGVSRRHGATCERPDDARTPNTALQSKFSGCPAPLLGVDARTSRRWANGERDVPAPAARFLLYLIAICKTGEQAMRKLGGQVYRTCCLLVLANAH
jgi:hypothetical protein